MDLVNEISLDGFQVVSNDFFCNYSRILMPTVTVWDGTIGFSKQDLILLNACENVIMQIHPTDKKMIIIPTTSKDPDAIHWIKRSTPLEAKKLSCPKLTEKLYASWGWDKNMIYRSTGRLVMSGNKVMLFFDFSEPEKWKRPEAKNAV